MVANSKFLFTFLLILSLNVQFSFSSFEKTVEHPFSHHHIDVSILQKLVDFPLENKTLEAIEKVEKLLLQYPNVPVLYVLNSFLHINFMFNYKTFALKKQFLSNTKKGLKLTKKWLKINPQDPDAHFFQGALLSYKAMLWLQEKKFLKAISSSFAVLKHMRKAISLGNIADAYYALSQYHYYKYQFAKTSTWVRANELDLKKGYEYLQKTIKDGTFMRQEASMSSLTMQINDRYLGNIENIISQKIITYPSNKFYLTKALHYHLLTGNWEKMLNHAEKIANLLKLEPLAGQSAHLELNYYLVVGHYQLNKHKKAKKYLENFDENRKNLNGFYGDKFYIKAIKPYRRSLMITFNNESL